MKILRVLTLALLVLAGATGCIQEDKVVKLKPDGSGTIEQTVIMGKEMLAQMQQMTGLAGEKPPEGSAPPAFSLLNETKLKEAAAGMGEGVTFVSAKPVTTPTGEGFHAIYAFADINKVKLSKDLGDSLPSSDSPGLSVKKGKGESDPVTFSFAKGSPATLTVNLPQPKLDQAEKPEKEKPEQPEAAEGMAMMMMQQMFKDMKFGLFLEFAGSISETNAEHVNGTRVTLMEMDFGKVMADPVKFKALSKAKPKSLDEARALLKGVEGIKAETQPEVTVKFQ